MSNELHPAARAMLERSADQPGFHTMTPAEARAAQRAVALPSSEPEAVASVEDAVVRGEGHGVPVRVYTPDVEGDVPALVWAHGGGFVLGDVETEDPAARALANATECVVASVDYRLAPEHPFPAALTDVYAVTEWAADGSIPGTDGRVVVGGASAGGTLAAATALLARDRADGPRIDHQVLVYPSTSFVREFDQPDEEYFLSAEAGGWFGRQYLPHPLCGHNPYASPLEATTHADLPPATVVTAEFDRTRPQADAYVAALERDGVPVDHHHYDDMIHAFFGNVHEPEWERAREAMADVAASLDERFER